MKYYTTQWYNDGLVSQMHEPMRKTQNAAQFSEKFFEKLYRVEKKNFIRYYKRAAKLQRIPFDTESTEKQFGVNYEENLAFVKANLPEEILANVKDVRVLALGSAEYGVAEQIERYCGKLKRKCNEIEDQYEEELEKVAEKIGWDTVHALDNLIDAQIESIEDAADDIIVCLYVEETRTNVTVVLHGSKLPQNAQSAIGGVVCRHELTEDGEALTLGMLCVDSASLPFTFEATAKSLEIKCN